MPAQITILNILYFCDIEVTLEFKVQRIWMDALILDIILAPNVRSNTRLDHNVYKFSNFLVYANLLPV